MKCIDSVTKTSTHLLRNKSTYKQERRILRKSFIALSVYKSALSVRTFKIVLKTLFFIIIIQIIKF